MRQRHCQAVSGHIQRANVDGIRGAFPSLQGGVHRSRADPARSSAALLVDPQDANLGMGLNASFLRTRSGANRTSGIAVRNIISYWRPARAAFPISAWRFQIFTFVVCNILHWIWFSPRLFLF